MVQRKELDVGQSKSVGALLPVQSRAVSTGVSNPLNIGALDLEASQVYVEVTNIGAGGVLDVRLEDAWEDIAGKYTPTGDQAIGIAANGITRIPPDAVRGKYMRIAYEVKTNPITFGVHVVKAEP